MATLADEIDYVKCLYYGPFGTGKTTNLAHLAHLGKVQYIRPDRGLKARPLRELGVPIDRINIVTELRPDVLDKMTWEWAEALEADPDALAGIVLDTATEMVVRRIEAAVDVGWGKFQRKAARSSEEPDESMRYFVDRDYYQPVTQEISRLVRHWVDLPCHVGIACQNRRDVDDDTGEVKYGPEVNPALQGTLVGYMGVVIRTEVVPRPGSETDWFLGHPRPAPRYTGKDQYHALPRVLVQPTLDRVIGYVRGDLESKTDPIQEEYRVFLRAKASKETKK
jgi:hypothetical protein